jgi:hypothetical protein
MKPMTRIHNSETNEVIDREMTDAEFAEHQKQQAEGVLMAEAKAQLEAAKESAQAKLEALGLTVGDLKALGL